MCPYSTLAQVAEAITDAARVALLFSSSFIHHGAAHQMEYLEIILSPKSSAIPLLSSGLSCVGILSLGRH